LRSIYRNFVKLCYNNSNYSLNKFVNRGFYLMRQKLLLLAAVVFGVLAFFLTYKQLQYEKNKLKARTKKVRLIRMKATRIEGDSIETGDIEPYETERFKTNTSDEISWRNRKTDALKHKLDQVVARGTILRYSDLQPEKIRQKDGLAGIINPGQRAISISVDSTSSVNNLIKPGDSVDIIGTFRFPEMKGDRSMDVITMTILQNVYIIATGKNMPVARRVGQAKKSKGYSTVTLSLSPKEVEMIIFATQKGRLVLSLRSYNESKFEKNLQSVNFKYLEESIPEYNKERERNQRQLRY